MDNTQISPITIRQLDNAIEEIRKEDATVSLIRKQAEKIQQHNRDEWKQRYDFAQKLNAMRQDNAASATKNSADRIALLADRNVLGKQRAQLKEKEEKMEERFAKERMQLVMDKKVVKVREADVARREQCLEDYGELFGGKINETTGNEITGNEAMDNDGIEYVGLMEFLEGEELEATRPKKTLKRTAFKQTNGEVRCIAKNGQ